MTPQETLLVLTAVELLDNTFRLREADDRATRAIIWSQTLHPNMTEWWASRMVKRHYSRIYGVPITAAELNRLWKDEHQYSGLTSGPYPLRADDTPGSGPAAYRAELERIRAEKASDPMATPTNPQPHDTLETTQ